MDNLVFTELAEVTDKGVWGLDVKLLAYSIQEYLDNRKPFAYYIETELQNGSMEGSFIKADSMKYKYIADGCDMIGGPIVLYK